MAIKIKKKDSSSGNDPSEAPELLDESGAPVGAPSRLGEDADPILKASWETASWVEENRYLVLGIVGVVFLAIVGGYFGLQVLESQNEEASSTLTPALEDYSTMIEGSPELESLKSNPDIEAPEKTFETNQARWEAVYAGANETLSKHPQGEIAQAATLMKASAAAQLGKTEEAIQLYESYRATSNDDSMKVPVLQGLAGVYASAEKWDEALETLDELSKLDDSYASAVDYQKARILERAGRGEDARKLYHSILEEDPNHPSKADIERRLATM